MLDINILINSLKERFGSSRVINNDSFKHALINSSNDLISEFKQNICIYEIQTEENKKIIKIPNIAYIYTAKFDNANVPLVRLANVCNDSRLKLIVLDTQSVRLEPFSIGKLEIMGSFFIDTSVSQIPLTQAFQRAILQGATLDLYIMLDKPLEHIKAAKMLLNDIKDDLRTQINKAQERHSLLTKNVII